MKRDYHINYGVIKGFLVLGKAVTTHVRKYRNFSRVWYRQSAADTSFTFRATRLGWWTNGKAYTIPNTRSFVKIFSDYGCQNTEKFVSLTGSDIRTFLETEENQCKKRNEKTESYVFRGFGNGILTAENEIAQLSCLKGNLKANIENV